MGASVDTCEECDGGLPQPRRSVYKVVDEQFGETVFYKSGTQEQVTRWLDSLLYAVKGFRLLSALNDIQTECNPGKAGSDGAEVFPNKFSMPLIIVNLVLKEHGLKIVYGLMP